MTDDQGWDGIVALIESVAASPDVLAAAIDEARSTSSAIAALDPADIARRTRDLMTAATRAIAARRGPTEAELAFVEDLAVTRAEQGVGIAEVLGAIHAASRRIWAATRLLAREQDVDPALLLQARELYEDWAEAVRQRLLNAHRTAASGAGRRHPRHDDLVRRLLQGGSAAVLAADEAGLDAGCVWVGVAFGADGQGANRQGVDVQGAVLSWTRGSGLVGRDDGVVMCLVSRLPHASPPLGVTFGYAGPGDVRDVPQLRRLAESAGRAAVMLHRTGTVHIAEVAPAVAIMQRPDLAAALAARHAEGLAALGANRDAVVATVRRWVESGQDATRTARAEYVHPNTVRNRVAAMHRATGLDPTDAFDALTLWWLCVQHVTE